MRWHIIQCSMVHFYRPSVALANWTVNKTSIPLGIYANAFIHFELFDGKLPAIQMKKNAKNHFRRTSHFAFCNNNIWSCDNHSNNDTASDREAYEICCCYKCVDNTHHSLWHIICKVDAAIEKRIWKLSHSRYTDLEQTATSSVVI